MNVCRLELNFKINSNRKMVYKMIMISILFITFYNSQAVALLYSKSQF